MSTVEGINEVEEVQQLVGMKNMNFLYVTDTYKHSV